MSGYVQTRTNQGFVPFRGVSIELGDGRKTSLETFERAGNTVFMGDETLIFDLRTPRECVALEKSEKKSTWRYPAAQTTLAHLGACMVCMDGEWRPHVGALASFAQRSGPLFGGGDGKESYRSWAYAADTAMIAIRLQECINKKRDPKTLQSLNRVNKVRLRLSGSGTVVSSYALSFRSGRAGDPMFDRLPLVRRSTGDGRIFYAFIFAGDQLSTGDIQTVECLVIAVPVELTKSEFHLLSAILGVSHEAEIVANDRLIRLLDGDDEALTPFGDSAETGLLLCDTEVLPEEPFSQNDLCALEALVQAMTVAHLAGVHVDVFQGDRMSGFLSFESLFSWLWYDFARDSGVASIGYCEVCGRPFSLVGHRGIERRYCSQACKTSAKNERSRINRERTRKLFDEGCDVVKIASEVYGGGAAAQRHVRADLSKWVQLKHRIEEEACTGSMTLLNRCMNEQLDMNRLISGRCLHMLKALKDSDALSR